VGQERKPQPKSRIISGAVPRNKATTFGRRAQREVFPKRRNVWGSETECRFESTLTLTTVNTPLITIKKGDTFLANMRIHLSKQRMVAKAFYLSKDKSKRPTKHRKSFPFFVGQLLFLLIFPGCFTIVPTVCEGGYCGVKYTPARNHAPPQVTIVKKGETIPQTAKLIATFHSPKTTTGCSTEVLDHFRGKAALLGFDGVANVESITMEGKARCTGQAYILLGDQP
jgi:hypothetical protein